MTEKPFDLKRVVHKRNVILPPKDVEFSKDPDVYRRDILYKWIESKTGAELKEINELENMFILLKGSVDEIMYEKLMGGKKELSPRDLAHFKLLQSILVDLNKIKYGEKRINVNFGYKDIQEAMFPD